MSAHELDADTIRDMIDAIVKRKVEKAIEDNEREWQQFLKEQTPMLFLNGNDLQVDFGDEIIDGDESYAFSLREMLDNYINDCRWSRDAPDAADVNEEALDVAKRLRMAADYLEQGVLAVSPTPSPQPGTDQREPRP